MIEKKQKSFVIQAQWFSSAFSGMTKTSLSFRLEHFFFNFKYLTVNRKLDICVADNAKSVVLFVNAFGKLRFRYTRPPSITKETFHLRGIATDSQNRILITDCDNNLIHIVDKDGHFICYIYNCSLSRPWGLCVDSRDNLFVAEIAVKVKKIQH